MSDTYSLIEASKFMNDYQRATRETAIYPDAMKGGERAITYLALGLAGEAGEVANKIKKYLRDGTPYDELVDVVFPELGDVLWYLARLADELAVAMSEVSAHNLIKLSARQAAGTIQGSGDNR